MKLTVKAFFLIMFFLSVPLLSVEEVSALGISPAPVELPNAVNGIRFEKKVTISRTDVGGTDRVIVRGVGDGMRYIELPKQEFIFPEGEKKVEYSFFIVPSAAPNGQFEATLFFEKQARPLAGEAGASASVQEAIGTRVLFTVTDEEIKSFEVTAAELEDTEVGLPLNLTYYIRNNGNVDVELDSITLSLTDITDSTNAYVKVFEEDLGFVKPGQTNNFQQSFLERMPQGEYSALVTFYEDEKVVYEHKAKVKVYPPGTLGQSIEFSAFQTDKKSYNLNDDVEFLGVVENTGQTSLRGVMYTEIYKDEEKIETKRSQDILIPIGQKREARNEYTLSQYGIYKFVGYFDYGGVQTEKKSITIEVTRLQSSTPIAAVGGGVVLGGSLLAFLIKRSRRKKLV